MSGGENISSVQVEKALAAHPAVAEVAVVGIADDRWGEVPKAWVALRPGHAGEADELVEWIREPAGPLQGAQGGGLPARAPQGRHRQDPQAGPQGPGLRGPQRPLCARSPE